MRGLHNPTFDTVTIKTSRLSRGLLAIITTLPGHLFSEIITTIKEV